MDAKRAQKKAARERRLGRKLTKREAMEADEEGEDAKKESKPTQEEATKE